MQKNTKQAMKLLPDWGYTGIHWGGRAKYLRVVNMTESIWPNKYDINLWTWPKNDKDKRELVEHDQKLPQRRTWTVEYDQK